MKVFSIQYRSKYHARTFIPTLNNPNINMVSEKITRKKWTTPAYRQCADPPFPEFQHISHSAHVVQAQILPCCTQRVEINAFRIQYLSVLNVSTHNTPKQAHATLVLFFPFFSFRCFYHLSIIFPVYYVNSFFVILSHQNYPNASA